MSFGGSEVASEIPTHACYRRLVSQPKAHTQEPHGLPHSVIVISLSLQRQLARQQPPAWNCRTMSTSHRSDGPAPGAIGRVIVLHGDQRGHTFEAHIFIGSYPTFPFAVAHLYTTERPVAGRVGATRFPETVRVVREVMGADAQVVFGNKVAIAVD